MGSKNTSQTGGATADKDRLQLDSGQDFNDERNNRNRTDKS